jgi:hypothetical protein
VDLPLPAQVGGVLGIAGEVVSDPKAVAGLLAEHHLAKDHIDGQAGVLAKPRVFLEILTDREVLPCLPPTMELLGKTYHLLVHLNPSKAVTRFGPVTPHLFNAVRVPIGQKR